MAKSSPALTPDPCQVHIDKAAVSSMEASITARIYRGIDPPEYCPKDESNATKQLAVAGVSCLLAAVGALGFSCVTRFLSKVSDIYRSTDATRYRGFMQWSLHICIYPT